LAFLLKINKNQQVSGGIELAKLRECKTCHHEVAPSARVCPNCGAKLKMGRLTKAVIIIAAIIIIGLIVSAGNNKTNKTTPGKQAGQTQLSKQGTSSNVKIAVLSMQTTKTIGDNQFTKVNSQGVFKVIKLSITNNQKDAITVDSNSFKLYDSQNREYTASSEAFLAMESSTNPKMPSFFLKQLNPGITTEGYIAYDVPADAKGFVMKAHGGVLGTEITLKVE
jgi:RNA polymerase subunit RPABC4/transcription elongation factor Spt4